MQEENDPKEMHVCGPARPKNLKEAGDDRIRFVFARLKALLKVVEEAYPEVCALLWDIQEGEYYRKEGRSTFADFVCDFMGMTSRKANYLVAIYRKLVVQAHVPESVLRTIEWTKAAQISRLPSSELKDPQKRMGWIDKAKEEKLGTIIADVSNAKLVFAGKKPDAEPWESYSFRMVRDQMRIVRLALDAARKLLASDHEGHLLSMICAEFLAGRCNDITLSLKDALDSISRSYEVDILAVKEKSGKEDVAYASPGMRRRWVEAQKD